MWYDGENLAEITHIGLPEPVETLGLSAGIAALLGLDRRGHRRESRR